jgi:hypothetical protein
MHMEALSDAEILEELMARLRQVIASFRCPHPQPRCCCPRAPPLPPAGNLRCPPPPRRACPQIYPNAPNPVGWVFPKWYTNELAGGSYTNWPAGLSAEVSVRACVHAAATQQLPTRGCLPLRCTLRIRLVKD